MPLVVPAIPSDASTLSAALLYAKAGWYVVPVKHDTKAPTVLGKGWQHQSSRDPEVIASWFAGTNHALGLHVGRSGAVVFDVDAPTLMHDDLKLAIHEGEPPFQSTRDNDPHRGHYVFLQPEGRDLGNGRGTLGKDWGEIRGANGIIVVEPSSHTKDHGRYLWMHDEDVEVPALPPYLLAHLPEYKGSRDAATDADVERFLGAHSVEEGDKFLSPIIDKYKALVNGGSARHEALVEVLPWLCRDAKADLVNARLGHDTLLAMATSPSEGRGVFRAGEFESIFAWSVGQVHDVDADARRAEVEQRLAPKPDDSDPFGMGMMSQADRERIARQAEKKAPAKRDSADYLFRDDVTNKWNVDHVLLANDVADMGPLALGEDHRFWTYEDGVWQEDQYAVRGRVIGCMKKRVKPEQWNTVAQILGHNEKVFRLQAKPTPHLINFRNGMLEWKTGHLHPHDPAVLSTIQLPYAWDPEADCPRFDAWLRSILSPDFVELAWQMIGYLMMSGNPMQVAFMFLGRGRNGKGTLIRVLGHLLGEGNYSAISLDDLTGNRFAAAGLYGKIANLAGDIDATFQESTARFKMLTGEDVFTAENKGQPAFRFQNWAVPVFSANKAPGSADTSEGYLRRWIILKFDRQISDREKILHLDETFIPELPGIARRGIEALQRLMVQGHFKDDGDVAVGKAEFTEQLDQVRQWIDQCCEADPEYTVKRDVLYDSYKFWADKTGSGRLKAAEFYNRLDNAGFELVKVGGVRSVKGLRVVQLKMIQSEAFDPLLS